MSAKILILGTGIAGLTAALKLAESADVTLVAKDEAMEGATRYAQGGIASVWSESDSFEEHIQDTRIAGAGLCHEKIVQICVHEGPERVKELIDWGVAFTKNQAKNQPKNQGDTEALVDEPSPDPAEVFDLHREGGHRQRRILHADDLTGLAIQKTLLQKARNHPRITFLEYHIAVDLIVSTKAFRSWRGAGRCLGAYVLNTKTGEILTLAAQATLLATGGAGKVYLYTSNPDTATGDGIAMAYRAGARIANLEFIQFHPTCLYHPNAKSFLISEALRGEGATLKTLGGKAFMHEHHPSGDLAPRDIVARAIDVEMKRTGDRHVLLDATALGRAILKKKFPNIYETCQTFGIDIAVCPIPVVPAAHYICGGVVVGEYGETTIPGLYALGEISCTGLHGANRLASNSLLEAVVFAHRVSEHIKPLLQSSPASDLLPGPLPEWNSGQAVPLEERIDIAANWLEIRNLMWNYVGIVRSNRRLTRARARIELLKSEVDQYYWNTLLTKDLIELRNLLQVADLIVQCASLRKESRGLHYTVDYPYPNDTYYLRDTVL